LKRGTAAVLFRPIELEQDGETCVRFRADSFIESFGSADAFFREAGPQASGYLAGLRSKMEAWPGSCVHAWLDGEIVGQVEVRRDRTDKSRAHILLYYLRPDVRGQGFGDDLDAYVVTLLRNADVTHATLRVSPTNARAVAYYRKHGWHDMGQDPENRSVHLLERRAGEG
jgi:ribosomal protein S18 acetylase RimI-like enzyme